VPESFSEPRLLGFLLDLTFDRVQFFADLFPGSTHIKAVGLRESDDFAVWEWAKQHESTSYQRTQIFIEGYCVWATR